MKFDFFTFGGGQFWEDVFFYQKWRIQRNYKTKNYRLLDNWDICRYKGSFEECRKAFVKYIEIHELARQKGHMIIMLHGLGDTKNIFKPLWRSAIADGYLAAAINYPSTMKRQESHIRQLEFFLNHLEDVKEVSFITKGSGGMILSNLMNRDSEWKTKIQVKRIAMINPPSKKNSLIKRLSSIKLFNNILGPLLLETAQQDCACSKIVDKNIEVGVIKAENKIIKKFFDYELEDDKKSAKQFAEIHSYYICPIQDKRVVRETMNFIKYGKYSIG